MDIYISSVNQAGTVPEGVEVYQVAHIQIHVVQPGHEINVCTEVADSCHVIWIKNRINSRCHARRTGDGKVI